MKKLFLLVAFMLSLASCSTDCENIPEQVENSEIRPFLEACVDAAYKTHAWMAEENSCEEYECCWEYVPTVLRSKYEDGAKLSVDELESILANLEKSPSFTDTLAEYDEFVNLDYYRDFGLDWFSPNYGYEPDDF